MKKTHNLSNQSLHEGHLVCFHSFAIKNGCYDGWFYTYIILHVCEHICRKRILEMECLGQWYIHFFFFIYDSVFLFIQSSPKPTANMLLTQHSSHFYFLSFLFKQLKHYIFCLRMFFLFTTESFFFLIFFFHHWILRLISLRLTVELL